MRNMKWFHRRLMAYISLSFAIILYSSGGISFALKMPNSLAYMGIIAGYATSLLVVVGYYMKLSTDQDRDCIAKGVDPN